jgi:plasmid stabilization system protein ParE
MPTRFEVRFTRKAERDIEEIWTFIAQDSIDEASRFITQLDKHIDTLERFPVRCPLISENELLRSSYRHLIHGKYRIIIRVSGKTVWVVRIVHGARLLEAAMLESAATEYREPPK